MKKGFILLRSIFMIGAIAALTIAASGAIFKDSVEVDENNFASGTVDISANPPDNAISMTNMKPGDSVTSTLTVVNSGSLDFTYDMSAKKDAGISAFYDVLDAKIEQGGTTLYQGPLKDLLQLTTGRRQIASGASEDLTITVSLPLTADNAVMNKYTKVAFDFNAEQL